MTSPTRRQIGTSILWSGAGAALLRVGQLAVGVFAARVLVPHDFGVFAIAMVVYAVVVNVSDLGVSSAVIREWERLDELAPTAVTLSLVSSALIAAATAMAAHPVAVALGAPESAPAIQVLSLVVLLAGPSAVPSALLTRGFRQDLKFRADAASFLAANLTMIPLALLGWGAMALAWSRVLGQLASVIVLIALAPRRYPPRFDRRAAGELIRFGVPLIGANLVGLALDNADSVTVNRVNGTPQLGSYTLANNVASWPQGLMQPILLNVGLPLVSRLRTRPGLLERFVALSLSITTGSFYFGSAVIGALAGPLVLTLYGSKWTAAIPILSVLAFAGAVRGMVTPLTDVLVACRATHALFVINLVWLVVLVPSLVLGSTTLGPVGAAWAHLATLLLVVVPLMFFYIHRVTGMALREPLIGMLRPFLLASLAAAAAYLVSRLCTIPWTGLVAGGVVASALYLVTSHRWIRDQLRAAHALAGLLDDPEPEASTRSGASGGDGP